MPCRPTTLSSVSLGDLPSLLTMGTMLRVALRRMLSPVPSREVAQRRFPLPSLLQVGKPPGAGAGRGSRVMGAEGAAPCTTPADPAEAGRREVLGGAGGVEGETFHRSPVLCPLTPAARYKERDISLA